MKLIDAYYILNSGHKIQLNSWPLQGQLDDVQCWADKRTQNTNGVLEFEYQPAKCFNRSKCAHLDYVGWTPFHPEWKCAIGGKCHRWSTICYECPKSQIITEP
jgi:hypothetical protein